MHHAYKLSAVRGGHVFFFIGLSRETLSSSRFRKTDRRRARIPYLHKQMGFGPNKNAQRNEMPVGSHKGGKRRQILHSREYNHQMEGREPGLCGRCSHPEAYLRCSRCKSVQYCNIDCQRYAWTHGGHKEVCKDILKPKGVGGENYNGGSTTPTPPIDWIPDEILHIILSRLDAKTLMITAPQVCKRWRGACQGVKDVHLDFSWYRDGRVPLRALAGWRGRRMGVPAVCGVSGMCELFPRTTSVTLGLGVTENVQRGVKDAHLIALVEMCPGLTRVSFDSCGNITDSAVLVLADRCSGLTHADFGRCSKLTDAALRALADKCRELTHANFSWCDTLTNAGVLELADKCRGLTHADFLGCDKLTDAGVLVLVAKCPGLTHASFGFCKGVTSAALLALAENGSTITRASFYELGLTDAVVLAVADKCRGLTHVEFGGNYQLTDAAAVALADKCHGLTHVDFGSCGNLTDKAVLALADRCTGLTHADFGHCGKLTDAAVLALTDKCRGLTHVNFSGSINLTDAAVLALADKCPGLTDANFEECEHLTDAAAISLATNCSNMIFVNFRGCLKLTDAVALALADSCPGLTNVFFGDYGVSTLTDAAVLELVDSCPRLQFFMGCSNIADATRAVVEAQRPNCHFF